MAALFLLSALAHPGERRPSLARRASEQLACRARCPRRRLRTRHAHPNPLAPRRGRLLSALLPTWRPCGAVAAAPSTRRAANTSSTDHGSTSTSHRASRPPPGATWIRITTRTNSTLHSPLVPGAPLARARLAAHPHARRVPRPRGRLFLFFSLQKKILRQLCERKLRNRSQPLSASRRAYPPVCWTGTRFLRNASPPSLRQSVVLSYRGGRPQKGRPGNQAISVHVRRGVGHHFRIQRLLLPCLCPRASVCCFQFRCTCLQPHPAFRVKGRRTKAILACAAHDDTRAYANCIYHWQGFARNIQSQI
uniref:Uncharacterized protein n=1 Tax=Setaria italica TaxID=4555 RepID=K3ZVJ4_SETIT